MNEESIFYTDYSYAVIKTWASQVHIPTAMLIAALTPELVCWENSENSFFRTEILPLNSRVGFQVVCKNWRGGRRNTTTTSTGARRHCASGICFA